MGIVPQGYDTLTSVIGIIGGFSGCRMMELGDQQMMTFHDIPEGSAAKSWFERMGVQHTSVDINGDLGAIKLDLSVPIERPEWLLAFDIVTDYGTSEHVGKSLTALYNCRANVHRWCRAGGLMLFSNPKTGHWPDHGFHCFTEKHYHDLAAACGYDAIRVFEHPTCGNTTTGYQISAVLLKRENAPFVSESEYARICAGTVFPS